MNDAAATLNLLFVAGNADCQVYQEAIARELPVTLTVVADARGWPEGLAPDLVVLGDANTDDARALLKTLKSDPRLRHAPLVALTPPYSAETQLALLEAGADDFIEHGAPPEILVARLKAQMRHKVAIERLNAAALDRDVFAAGVLQDIGSLKGTIIALCEEVKGALAADPVGRSGEIRASLEKLARQGSRLGAYAADVIQSVRETQRAAKVAAETWEPLLAWVKEVLAHEGAPLTWEMATPLRPVLADRSFLRLALLKIAQHALGQAEAGGTVKLLVSQRAAPGGRQPMLTTSVRDFARPVTQAAALAALAPGFGADDTAMTLALVPKVLGRMDGQATATVPADGGPGLVVELTLPAAGSADGS